MIHDFQHVVGEEARAQYLEANNGKLPERICACVGGGSNSIGLFGAFLNDPVKIIGVEPLGKGKGIGENAASISYGKESVMHGFDSLVLLDEEGKPASTYSVASGLDYPSVGPEHAFLHEVGRVDYEPSTTRRLWMPSSPSRAWKASSRRSRALTPSLTLFVWRRKERWDRSSSIFRVGAIKTPNTSSGVMERSTESFFDTINFREKRLSAKSVYYFSLRI
jgi:hypothetical protein